MCPNSKVFQPAKENRAYTALSPRRINHLMGAGLAFCRSAKGTDIQLKGPSLDPFFEEGKGMDFKMSCHMDDVVQRSQTW